MYSVKGKKISFVNNGPGRYAIKESILDKSYVMNGTGVFYDFGGYIGDTSIGRILYDHPKEIYIFEPQPNLIPIIKKNIASFSDIISKKNIKIHIINKAIGIKNGALSLFLKDSTSLGDAGIFNKKQQGAEEIKCEVQDIKKYVGNINYLKMDIEGGEWPILKYWKNNFDCSISKGKIDCHFYDNQQIEENRIIVEEFVAF